MIKTRFLLAVAVTAVVALHAWGASAQCPAAINSRPTFSNPGGNVFGKTALQRQAWFGAKADAVNGVLCGAIIQDLPQPINPGDAVDLSDVDALVYRLFPLPASRGGTGGVVPGGGFSDPGGVLQLALLTAVPHEWVSSLSSAGVPQLTRPRCSDLRDAGASCSGNYTSVTTLGATGDGVTDVTAAIQAAIDSKTSGGVVYFPVGHYCIKTGPLTVTTRAVTLLGESRQGSQYIITSEDFSKGTVLDACGANVSIVSMSADHDQIQSLHILGSNSPSTTQDAVLLNSGCSECTVSDSEVQLGRYALNATNAYEVYLLSSSFDTAYGKYIVYLTGVGGYIWKDKIDQAYPAGTPAGFIAAPVAWQNAHVYAAKALVYVGSGCPSGPGCWYLQAMNGGTSGTSQPIVAPYGTRIVDGGVTWQLSSPAVYDALGIDTAAGGNLVVDSTDFSNNATNEIVIENSLSGSIPNFVTVVHSAFCCYLSNGISMSAGYGAQIVDNQFGQCLVNNCAPISAFGSWAGDLLISSNIITGQYVTGIFIGAGQRTVISANQFGPGTTAISIGANDHNFNIENNMFGSAIWGDPATAITVATGSSDYYNIIGNSCDGTTTGIVDGGTGTHKVTGAGTPNTLNAGC